MQVVNLPLGPYDSADTAVGEVLAVTDGGVLCIEVTAVAFFLCFQE